MACQHRASFVGDAVRAPAREWRRRVRHAGPTRLPDSRSEPLESVATSCRNLRANQASPTASPLETSPSWGESTEPPRRLTYSESLLVSTLYEFHNRGHL
jgi:hypothetical protein